MTKQRQQELLDSLMGEMKFLKMKFNVLESRETREAIDRAIAILDNFITELRNTPTED